MLDLKFTFIISSPWDYATYENTYDFMFNLPITNQSKTSLVNEVYKIRFLTKSNSTMWSV